MPQITIYLKGRKINIGELKDNGVFVKRVKKSKHLLRKLDAWGFDYKALVDYILPQAEHIFVYDSEEECYYYLPAVKFGELQSISEAPPIGETVSGKIFKPSAIVEIRHYNHDQENGTQIFVSRRHWYKFGRGEWVTELKRIAK